jgi:hypothetical protein
MRSSGNGQGNNAFGWRHCRLNFAKYWAQAEEENPQLDGISTNWS